MSNLLKKNRVLTFSFIFIGMILSNISKNKIIILISILLILIIISIFIGYKVEKITNKKQNKKQRSLIEYIGFSSKYSLTSIIVGMISNTVFGFIDNASLMFGMDALNKYFPGGPLTRAGYGNMLSSTIGCVLGEYIGNIINNLTNIRDTPLWSQSFGMLLGSFIGIYMPLIIIKDPEIKC